MSAPLPKPVERLYQAGILVTLIGLPFSTWLMSQGALLCGLAWIADRWYNGPLFRQRGWAFFKLQAPLIALATLFAWQIIGLLWTSDLTEGLNVLRIKSPLIVFPIILITGRWDRKPVFHWMARAWAVILIASCIAVLAQGLLHDGPLEPRDWSPFVSHIRLSLFLAFGIAWWWAKWLQRTSSLFLPFVLSVLGGLVIWKTATLTGAFLLPFIALLLAYWVGFDRIGVPKSASRKFAVYASVVALFAVGWIGWQMRPTYPNIDELPKVSEAGTHYAHYPERTLKEGDHFVWVSLAESEMRSLWNRRSAADFDGLDGRNQELKMTLIRHLASLGLPKDSVGVSRLTAQQIEHIEMGIPSDLELTHGGLLRRWDVLRFEIMNARDGGNPSGHSVIQRIHFLEAAKWVQQSAPIFGVGTGDLNGAFAEAYDAMNSPLSSSFRLRAHNQYVSFLLAGGPISLVLWIAVMWISAWNVPTEHRLEAWLFLAILAASCCTEDTLETQAGVTFAGLFLGLFGLRR